MIILLFSVYSLLRRYLLVAGNMAAFDMSLPEAVVSPGNTIEGFTAKTTVAIFGIFCKCSKLTDFWHVAFV